jgi:NAD dependent epimerase/dehydratase
MTDSCSAAGAAPNTEGRIPCSWRSRQVLITGAGGFIGSHLAEQLVQQGARVRAFVHYNSRGDPGLLSLLPPAIYEELEIVAGDLRDLPALMSAMCHVETVFHLGALIAIPYSYAHPVEVVQTNVLGTLNVLLAARENGVQRIVHTSSSEVYGTAVKVPIDENHPLQGQSPYSASKIGADKLAESFYCAYDLPVVTLRPFNTYGPRQSARAVIPTIVTQALTQDVIRLGNLDAQRDFTFVSDTVEGFLCAAETCGIEGETINLGIGTAIRVGELTTEILSLLGTLKEVRVDPMRLRPGKSEVQCLVSDNSLARARLGWMPQVSLRQGLTRTITWISEHLNLYRPQQYQV